MATSVCKTIPPHLPPSKEITCPESVGSSTQLFGSKSVENIVKSGLVNPIVKTTSKSAKPATFLRVLLMTGETCEILSRPVKARHEPATPDRLVASPIERFSNTLGHDDNNKQHEICVKTEIR